MTKTKSQKRRAKAGSRVKVRGKGDYDFEDEFTDPLGRTPSQRLDNLEKRVNDMGSKMPSKPKTEVGQIASKAGRLLGSMVGQGDLGDLAASGLAKLFGYGDYEVEENSLIKGAIGKSSSIPVFERNGKRGIRVTEREYIGDVVANGTLVNGSTIFSSNTYPINPALASTFPWLSTLAQQFDEWEPLGIVFEFVPLATEFSTAISLGTVIMATDYNVLDPAYTNKLAMEESDYACSTKPSNMMVHGIECKASERSTRVLYTRAGSVPSTGTLQLYDLGNFQIATQGMSQQGTVGELWISYDIAFYKKQLYSSQLGYSIPVYQAQYTPTSLTDLVTTVVSSAGNLTIKNTIGFLTFPTFYRNASFRITCSLTTTGTGVVPMAVNAVQGGLTNLTVFGQTFNAVTGSGGGFSSSIIVTISDSTSGYGTVPPGLQIILTGASGTLTAFYVYISQIPYTTTGVPSGSPIG